MYYSCLVSVYVYCSIFILILYIALFLLIKLARHKISTLYCIKSPVRVTVFTILPNCKYSSCTSKSSGTLSSGQMEEFGRVVDSFSVVFDSENLKVLDEVDGVVLREEV